MEFSILTFPFEQIGWGLRQLSLSSAVGNIFAIIIYLIVGAIPCGIFFMLKKKGIHCKMDYMLLILSILLLVILYYMINPGLLPATMLGMGKDLTALTFYSVLVAYLVLRMVTGTRQEDLNTLQKGLRVVLYIVMILFAWSVVAEGVINLPASIKNVQEGNSAAMDTFSFLYDAPDLTMTYVFLVFQSIVSALPNGLSVVAVYFCIKVLDELLLDSYSEKAVTMVKRVVSFCKKALIAVVVSEMVLNVGQLLLHQQLYQVNILANIPIFSILFLLVIHVMARYIEENQKLKQDNDLFI